MKLSLSDLLGIEHTAMWNIDGLRRKSFPDVSTDSRSVKEGELFVALRGESFDGHQFVETAFRRGAACAVVDRRANVHAYRKRPFLVVHDTTKALGGLANAYRKKFDIPFLAIAGSNGKTTTKEMITKVLASNYSVLSTEGNLNNQIGVPKTLFRLNRRHDIAVVEIGTNHFGELEYLCSILAPTHGLITNIGREHLEFFGSLKGVARAEGELIDALGTAGTGFVNADDSRIGFLATRLRRKVSYGFTAGSVRGKFAGIGPDGCAAFMVSQRGRRPFRVALRTPGLHAAVNALAAAAVGLSFGVPAGEIRRSLGNFSGVGKRMEVLRAGGLTVLNDTYNANPDSVLTALRTLEQMKTRGKKVVVLADMLELGESSRAEHERIGKAAGAMGIDLLFTFGKRAAAIHESAGLRSKRHFQKKDELTKALLARVAAPDIILIKGSRGMKMEEVSMALLHRHGGKAK
jgi:UDP-N-acetylmuramoyl-tripeptide--D-alanyl-D-alanine ligase